MKVVKRQLNFEDHEDEDLGAYQDERGVWFNNNDLPMGVDNDDTATTEEYEHSGDAEVEDSGTKCPHCGRGGLQISEAEGVFREEATAYLQTYAKKLVELETLKYLKEKEKKKGLRGLKSCLGSKKTK